MTDTLSLPILESGYSITEPSSVLAAATKGGFSRRRLDLEDASLSVAVSWILTEADYNTLITFFQAHLGVAFNIDLFVDNAEFQTRLAYFSSAGPQLTQIQGLNYIVSDTLEVLPATVDSDFDGGVVAIYAGSNANPIGYMDLLNKLVNTDWPT